MSGYYDEILDEIRQLTKNGEADEALFLIRKEMAMPYIPPEIEQELRKLQKDAVYAKTDKKTSYERSEDELLSMLKGRPVSQLTAAQQLSDRNLRGCSEEIRAYLREDPLPEAAALLIDAIAEQEIQEEFIIVKDGMEYTFWGDAVTPVSKSSGFREALGMLDELIGKDPAMLEMARSVLVHQAYLYLPLSYETEEASYIALEAIRQVSELMDDGETYRRAEQIIHARS
ncbi:MAG: DUF3196 domain-containing protein [Solobacterium sp.]|nr:DUF3196 domain-containing protein [Solobacterium sp.]